MWKSKVIGSLCKRLYIVLHSNFLLFESMPHKAIAKTGWAEGLGTNVGIYIDCLPDLFS